MDRARGVTALSSSFSASKKTTTTTTERTNDRWAEAVQKDEERVLRSSFDKIKDSRGNASSVTNDQPIVNSSAWALTSSEGTTSGTGNSLPLPLHSAAANDNQDASASGLAGGLDEQQQQQLREEGGKPATLTNQQGGESIKTTLDQVDQSNKDELPEGASIGDLVLLPPNLPTVNENNNVDMNKASNNVQKMGNTPVRPVQQATAAQTKKVAPTAPTAPKNNAINSTIQGQAPTAKIPVSPKVGGGGAGGGLPKAPTASLPNTPTLPETPKAPVKKAPTAVVPKTPTAVVPKTPTAVVPKTPTAVVPKTPTAAVPKTPTAAVPQPSPAPIANGGNVMTPTVRAQSPTAPLPPGPPGNSGTGGGPPTSADGTIHGPPTAQHAAPTDDSGHFIPGPPSPLPSPTPDIPFKPHGNQDAQQQLSQSPSPAASCNWLCQLQINMRRHPLSWVVVLLAAYGLLIVRRQRRQRADESARGEYRQVAARFADSAFGDDYSPAENADYLSEDEEGWVNNSSNGGGNGIQLSTFGSNKDGYDGLSLDETNG
mmetsp:Transcript_912/g.2591  ORF Transcript_912/g.2591 Transcript_912/m.2591 type:complete len:542 (+) Transcript_912:85-1710(+)